jgi:hypothetical protein
LDSSFVTIDAAHCLAAGVYRKTPAFCVLIAGVCKEGHWKVTGRQLYLILRFEGCLEQDMLLESMLPSGVLDLHRMNVIVI